MKIRDFIVFGVASGLNRAGMFLLIPILAIYLSPSDFGELSLFLVSATLLSTVCSLNISSIIAREVYEDLFGVVRYVSFFNFFLINILSIFICLMFIKNSLIVVFVVFIISEALFLVNSTYVRFKGCAISYLNLTILKFTIVIISFSMSFVYFEGLVSNVSYVLFLLAFSNVPILWLSIRFFLINATFKVFFFKRIKIRRCNGKYFIFAMTLVPHIIAQWINSSADRFFIKTICSSEELGVYSFAYSLSSVLLIVNAALALGLPQLCMKDKEFYSSNKMYGIIFILLSVCYIFFLVALRFIVPLFEYYDPNAVLDLIYVISSGIYFLSFYVYFSAIIFYERKGVLISKITVFTCFFSLLFLYPLTYLFGIFGTAIVTLLSYFIYMLIVWHYSSDAKSTRLILPIFCVLSALLFHF